MDKSGVLLAQVVLHSNKAITIPELQMVLKVITTTPRAMVVALSLAPPIIGTHRRMTSLLRNAPMSGTQNTL